MTDHDEVLGAAGRRALHAERAHSRRARGVLSAVAKALDIDPLIASTELPAVVERAIDDLTRQNLVYKIAFEHKITDPADLELIRGFGEEATMRRCAARLAAHRVTSR